MNNYIPDRIILDKYADLFVNFALNNGNGIKKGDNVLIQVSESAKPIYAPLRNAVLKAGGIPKMEYLAEDVEEAIYYDLASNEQLEYFMDKYYRGMVDQFDHSIFIISDWNMHVLEKVDSNKIMKRLASFKQYRKWREEKENHGKFSWTLGLYGTKAMADEAGLSLEDYWQQIIKACYLDEENPVDKWKSLFIEIETTQEKLNHLDIDYLNIKSDKYNLKVGLGEKRKWLGGSGANIPSFELFISPDWRTLEGTFFADQPLYRFGKIVKNIELTFEKGLIIKAQAETGNDYLQSMIQTINANKIGEFSLTDKRFSKINKFMAETLYDENFGGDFGNTHIAIGNAYQESYIDLEKDPKPDWDKLGFNESSIHTDIVSTANREVTAFLKDGTSKMIYKDGEFTI